MIEQKLQQVNDQKMVPIMNQIAVETARIKAAEENIVQLKKQALAVKEEMTSLGKTLTEAFEVVEN